MGVVKLEESQTLATERDERVEHLSEKNHVNVKR